MSSDSKPNQELLLTVLEYLDRNGYKESFDILLNDTGLRYLEHVKRTIEDLLIQKKLDELITYINSCDQLSKEEKNNLLKILKIRKFIELITNNCINHSDQKVALQFLRTEISPIMDNKDLLNTLTKLLFFKDISELKNYIQKNLITYEDDNIILNQISNVKIAPLEQLYNMYNQNMVKKYGINFDKYNVTKIKKEELYFTESKNGNIINIDNYNNIQIMEISHNKEYIIIGFFDLNISIFSLDKKTCENSNIINIDFIKNINLKSHNNLNENNSNEINLINFSYDDKYILILINKSNLNIIELNTWKIISLYNKIKEINYSSYITEKNNILLYSQNKLFLLQENLSNPSLIEIYSTTKNDIQKILFSNFLNIIILIPSLLSEIECINLSQKKIEFNIEIKEEIFSADISQKDEGKFLIINVSKTYPKIYLYDLVKRQIDKKYYGHIQKNNKILCTFGGNRDQYILSTSEDSFIYLWDRNISGLPKYQFKEENKIIKGLGMINSSFILSCYQDEIKVWTSYDIDDVKLNKLNDNNNNIIENKKGEK